ncbi:hypothetical protein H101_06668 [Trichophyton interdigitale H6]|nr:hypothetical protein H101_06668 [Trichophyton interdigitale H6]
MANKDNNDWTSDQQLDPRTKATYSLRNIRTRFPSAPSLFRVATAAWSSHLDTARKSIDALNPLSLSGIPWHEIDGVKQALTMKANRDSRSQGKENAHIDLQLVSLASVVTRDLQILGRRITQYRMQPQIPSWHSCPLSPLLYDKCVILFIHIIWVQRSARTSFPCVAHSSEMPS